MIAADEPILCLGPPPDVARTPSHQYFRGDRELLGVTRTLEASGVTNYDAPWFDDWSRRRGELVHMMIALENAGELDDADLDPRLVGYLDGYRKFRREVGGRVEYFETIVADEILGVAGTLDLVVCHPADHPIRRRLYDVKPGRARATAIQLAGYARLARCLYSRPVVFERAALILPGDGSYTVDPCREANDDLVFQAAVRLAHWRNAA